MTPAPMSRSFPGIVTQTAQRSAESGPEIAPFLSSLQRRFHFNKGKNCQEDRKSANFFFFEIFKLYSEGSGVGSEAARVI